MGKNWESNALCFADHTLVDHFKKMMFICGLIIQYFSRPTFKKLHLGGCRKQKDLSVLRQTIQQQDRKWPKNIQYFPTSTYTHGYVLISICATLWKFCLSALKNKLYGFKTK